MQKYISPVLTGLDVKYDSINVCFDLKNSSVKYLSRSEIKNIATITSIAEINSILLLFMLMLFVQQFPYSSPVTGKLYLIGSTVLRYLYNGALFSGIYIAVFRDISWRWV